MSYQTIDNRPVPQDFFKDWKQREALAENMIPMIGRLSRENNVICYIYGKSLVDISVIDIMKAHRAVRELEHNELSEFETHPVLGALCKLNLGHAHIDIGRIAVNYMQNGNGEPIENFVRGQVGQVADKPSKPLDKPQDVVLYGFGRIGRLMARILIDKTRGGDLLRLKAIVVRKGKAPSDLEKRASLLLRDSVHGPFNGTIRVIQDENLLVCNGNPIKVIYANSPSEVNYEDYGINNAIIVDNTGVWRDRAGLSQHLECKGASKVLLTAPGKGDLKNIVAGINCHDIEPEDSIISAASCTTNAIVPPLKVLDEKYGIVKGHVETVHSYTNDQNLIDNYHSAERRGRGAPLNMVITETGAAKAVVKALPKLAGKLSGNAIRVPTPNVSMAILNLQLMKATTRDELNEFMRKISLHSDYRKQIDFSESPETVSSDIIGSRTACVFDARATIVNGNSCVLYIWYDNEYGYSHQVGRVLEEMVGIKYMRYPLDY